MTKICVIAYLKSIGDAVLICKRIAELDVEIDLHFTSPINLAEEIVQLLGNANGYGNCRVTHHEAEESALPAQISILRKVWPLIEDNLFIVFLDPSIKHRDKHNNIIPAEKLLDDIFNVNSGVEKIIDQFARKSSLGMVVPVDFWRKIEDVKDAHLLSPFADALQLRLDLSQQGRIPGGMFWCRKEAVNNFLSMNINSIRFEVGKKQRESFSELVSVILVLSIDAGNFEICDARGVQLNQTAKPNLPWLQSERNYPKERDWAEEEICAWRSSEKNDVPIFNPIILPNNGFSLMPTISSLEAQWLATKPPIVIKGIGSTEIVNLLKDESNNQDSEWVLILRAGDILSEDAVFRMAVDIRCSPEWKIFYTDHDIVTKKYGHINPNFKPDFNIDYLRSFDYIDGVLVIKKSLFINLCASGEVADPAWGYDLALRAYEKLFADGNVVRGFGHVSEVLLHRATNALIPQHVPSDIIRAKQSALEKHLFRMGLAASVESGLDVGTFRLRWHLPKNFPLVSIIIPTRNQFKLLKTCIDSIIEKTSYKNYEILVVDNDSNESETLNYLKNIHCDNCAPKITVIRAPGPFNFSRINNIAARVAKGEFLLLLNNDVVVYHENWLSEMVSHGMRPEVGAVGARLLYGNGNIQHAGVVIGMGSVAGHIYLNESPKEGGHYFRARVTQNMSAVTGACLLVKTKLYFQFGGLDETAFPVPYNDVDLCLKIHEADYLIVWTPYATLWHLESASRALGVDVEKITDIEKNKREVNGVNSMYLRWLDKIAQDTFYNKNLSLRNTDSRISVQKISTWSRTWRPRKRIVAFRSDDHAVGHYRVKAPMGQLNASGVIQGIDSMVWFSLGEIYRAEPNSIVLQRPTSREKANQIKLYRRYLDSFFVYEIDDLLTDIPDSNPASGNYHNDTWKTIREVLSHCDRLVCSTDALADAYGKWVDGDTRVVPNYIERSVWSKFMPRYDPERKPRVGWAGGLTHEADLEMISPVVRELCEEVDFIFFGHCPELIRPYVKEMHVGVPFNLYPSYLASLNLDLALAPLELNAFNEAKSHLKLLEYGALGYPVVCSDIMPYQGGWPVFRVKNRAKLWIQLIRELVADRDALKFSGDRLRDYVFDNWSLEQNLGNFESAWFK